MLGLATRALLRSHLVGDLSPFRREFIIQDRRSALAAGAIGIIILPVTASAQFVYTAATNEAKVEFGVQTAGFSQAAVDDHFSNAISNFGQTASLSFTGTNVNGYVSDVSGNGTSTLTTTYDATGFSSSISLYGSATSHGAGNSFAYVATRPEAGMDTTFSVGQTGSYQFDAGAIFAPSLTASGILGGMAYSIQFLDVTTNSYLINSFFADAVAQPGGPIGTMSQALSLDSTHVYEALFSEAADPGVFLYNQGQVSADLSASAIFSLHSSRVLTPEPVTLGLGISGIGLFLRKRRR